MTRRIRPVIFPAAPSRQGSSSDVSQARRERGYKSADSPRAGMRRTVAGTVGWLIEGAPGGGHGGTAARSSHHKESRGRVCYILTP